MELVVTGKCPVGLTTEEEARISRAAGWLHWDGVRLYCNTHGVLHRIPAIVERQELV